MLFQYYQWLCTAIKGGTQGFLVEGSSATAQSQIFISVSPSVNLLHRSIPGEGPVIDGTRDEESFEILAKNTFAKGSHVLERARGNFGRHRASGISKRHESPLQTTREMRFVTAFPGERFFIPLDVSSNEKKIEKNYSCRSLKGLSTTGIMNTLCL